MSMKMKSYIESCQNFGGFIRIFYKTILPTEASR